MITVTCSFRPWMLILLSPVMVFESKAQYPQIIPNVWNPTNGMVTSIHAENAKNEVHVAGSFSYWDAPTETASLALVDAVSGIPDLGFTQSLGPIEFWGGLGRVMALCPDQSGGWFIGGQFTHVSGQERSCVARFDSNGALMFWESPVHEPVVAMGVFDEILVVATGTSVYGLDKATGYQLWVTGTNGAIHDLVIGVHDDNGLNPWFMIGGAFTSVSNYDHTVPCGGTAFISTLDGQPMMYGPSFYTANGGDGVVYDLELTEEYLFVGGYFDRVSAFPTDDISFSDTRYNIAAFGMDIISSTPINSPSNWAPEVLPAPGGHAYVNCMDWHNGKLYIGGEFRYVNGAPRNGLASVDGTGWPTSWDPGLSSMASGEGAARVDNILGLNASIYVGGYFSTMDSGFPYAAAFSESSGVQLIWDPGLHGYVEDMQGWNGQVLLAGQFSSAGELVHPRLTALNSLTGYPTATAFDANIYAGGQPSCMARKGDTLFVGGEYSLEQAPFVPGQVKRLAAFNALTGDMLDYNVELDGIVDCMILSEGTLYIGGRFTVVNGEDRRGFAALNATNGQLLGVNLLYSGEVYAMEKTGSTMYMSGHLSPDAYTSFSLAAIDLESGQFTSWSPPWVSYVSVIKSVNGHLYIGGQIMIDQAFRGIIEVDPVTGALLPWQSEASDQGWVKAIAGHGSQLIVGGSFSVMGGQPRSGLAMLDQVTGEATSWDPQVSGASDIESVCVANGRLYVGGNFTGISGVARNHFAMFDLPVVPHVSLSARTWLQGPYMEENGLMRDDLRSGGLLPITEPYTALGYPHTGGGGGEVAQPGVFDTEGEDAIVDWVLLELRAPASPSTVLASRAALLQRDGDIVATDGTSPVSFPLPAGPYMVAVRHRNHLGCMTAAAVTMGTSSTLVDFTVAGTATFGSEARRMMGDVMVLWSGDVTFNGQIKYTGTDNDRDAILQAIGGTVPTATVPGYRSEDGNLDGVVKYTGTDNDRDPILHTVGGVIPTNTRTSTLP